MIRKQIESGRDGGQQKDEKERGAGRTRAETLLKMIPE
jgi:hypothetical protein